jgi:hypothetical protein
MIMTANSGRIEMPTKLLEVDIRTDASEYIEMNYSRILDHIKTDYHIKEGRAEDLIQDVYISIMSSELEGKGFDPDYGGDDHILRVEQFVYGRIKKFARNPKYSSETIERSKTRVKSRTVRDMLCGNAEGELKTSSRHSMKNVTTEVTVVASSFDMSESENTSNISEFQRAYSCAAVADSTEDIIDTLSLAEQIDYCIDLCNMHDFKIMNLLQNIDTLGDLVTKPSKNKKRADPVFEPITKLVNEHKDFGEALMNVLSFSARNRAAFDVVMSTYN